MHDELPRVQDAGAALSAEASHRIANDLSLISALVGLHRTRLLQDGKSRPPAEVAALLDEVISRLETVVTLHRMLSSKPDAPTVDAAVHLRALCETLTSSVLFSGTLNFLPTPTGGCMVSRDQILPLALIANEAITNAIKYAHPTGLPVSISVGCRHDEDGSLVVKVRDDGVGLPDNFDPRVDGGLGFRSMRLLASQIDAELSFDSSPLGLCCVIRMPGPAGGFT